MNVNSNLRLPPSGSKLTDLPASLEKLGFNQPEIIEFLTKADKDGDGDGFVTSGEALKSVPDKLKYSIEDITDAWGLRAGDQSGKTLQTMLGQQETLDSITVENFRAGAMINSVYNADGSIEFGDTKYSFNIFDDTRGHQKLRLTDPQGNITLLRAEFIPQELLNQVVKKAPSDSSPLR